MKIDLKAWTNGYLQHPYLDIKLNEYEDVTVKLGFMPLTESGMFLEVLKPGQKLGTLVFIKCGTIFCIDKSVIRAGGFAPDGSEGMRLNFFWVSNALDTMHRQVKMDNDFSHNEDEIFHIDQVRNCF